MESQVNYTLVGLFVLLLGAGLVGGILWLTAGTEDKAYNFFRVYTTESVAGLSANAPVAYKGVQVGQVVGIRLDHDTPDLIELTLKIERGAPIREDTTARLVSRSITGVVNVELSGGGSSPPLVPTPDNPMPVIKSAPSLVARLEDAFNNLYFRLDSLFSEDNVDALGQTAENIRAITAAFADNRGRIDQFLASLETLSTRLAVNADALGKVMAGANTTLTNTSKLTEQLRKDMQPLLAQVKDTLATTDAAIKSFGTTSRDIGQAANESLQGIQQATRKTTPELNRLLAQLTRLADTMDRFVGAVERNPRMFLFGRPTSPPGPGE